MLPIVTKILNVKNVTMSWNHCVPTTKCLDTGSIPNKNIGKIANVLKKFIQIQNSSGQI